MADFKAQIRAEQLRADGTTNIKIRISHNRKTRYIKTNFYVKPSEFDPDAGKVIKRKNVFFINIQLRNKINEFEELILKQGPEINHKDINAILELLKSAREGELDFYVHLDKYAGRLEKEGRESYAASLRQTGDRLKEYSPLEHLPFSSVNYSFLTGFESYYAKKLKPNTIELHKRNIRTIFNDAISCELIGLELYPFRKVKIRKHSTSHRNLRIEDLALLVNYNPKNSTEERAKDLTLLSFYLIGINFKDLLLSKPDQSVNGRFHYQRSKTGKEYSIKLFPEAKKLIEKYKGGNEYLLRFMEDKIRNNMKKDRTTPLYKDITDQTNRVIKRIFKECELPFKISTYYMRHTWASLADELEIPKTVITLALGHGSNSVTDTYIYTDLKRVDEANKKVLEFLQKSLHIMK